MSDLYREAILDHYKRPRRKGHLENPDVQVREHNPFCGDEITIELKLADGQISDASFDGRGCAISQATASMLMEDIVGTPITEVEQWDQEFVLDMLGIEIGPVRMKCALLALNAIKTGINKNE